MQSRNNQRFLAALCCATFAVACSGTTTDNTGAAVDDTAGASDAALTADADAIAVGTDATAPEDADAAAPGTDAIADAGTDAAAGSDAVADVAPVDAAVLDTAGGKIADPNVDGPYTFVEFDDKPKLATGDTVAIHCAYPSAGPSAGPYPVIVVAHGFQLTPDKYYGYVRRLASFGYVAMTVDFPTSFFGNDNPQEAKDLAAALDWAANKGGVLAGKVDAKNAGICGHSLGGKVAFLATTIEPRFKAAIGLDPVDGGGPTGCNPPQCVDVTDAIGKLAIPSGFVGETTDSAGGMQPCAPKMNNFETFYTAVPGPSFKVTVNGANHMSFLDDTNGCLTCGFCNPATLSQAKVTDLSRSYVVAFFERNLRGIQAYDDYLTGATAQARYVTTGMATIESK